MSDAPRRRRFSWVAFTAGAVAMLALALAWSAWRKHEGAVDVLRAATAVVDAPELPAPSLPDTPRLPDVPIPRPK